MKYVIDILESDLKARDKTISKFSILQLEGQVSSERFDEVVNNNTPKIIQLSLAIKILKGQFSWDKYFLVNQQGGKYYTQKAKERSFSKSNKL